MKRVFAALAALIVCTAMLISCDTIISPATTTTTSVATTTTTTVAPRGGISGMVKDAVAGTALAGVSVTLYASDGSTLGTVSSGDDGTYSMTSIEAGASYYATFAKTGFQTVTYRGVSISEGGTTYMETMLQVNSTYVGTGTATGRITNASDGASVGGATLSFRAGVNTTTGTVLATATTDADDGTYSVTTDDLGASGSFTAEVSKSQFTTAYFTVTLAAGHAIDEQNASITPTLATSAYRVILDWGVAPADIDSHMTGPTGQGTERFHVYFSDEGYPESTDDPDVALDVDDTTSYGPETITIYRQKTGEYRYYVHDYSNLSASALYPSTALSSSGARVRIYRGATLAATYNVPTGRGGNCWDVFTLSGDTITPVNAISYIDDYAVGRALGEKSIFRNLPRK